MPNYSNETCDGCIHKEGETCGHTANWVDAPNISGYQMRPMVDDDLPACERFDPDLECRMVRATERLASATCDDTNGDLQLALTELRNAENAQAERLAHYAHRDGDMEYMLSKGVMRGLAIAIRAIEDISGGNNETW